MIVGLLGSGNMARALARGFGEPVLCSDAVPERARALAEQVNGEAVDSNRELARRADLVVLCHKPAQLEEIAGELDGAAKAVASVLVNRTVADLQAAYPGVPVFRFLPSIAVEAGRGVIAHARAPGIDEVLEQDVLELFGRSGTIVTVEERLLLTVGGLTSVFPAFLAVIAEALVDALVYHGLDQRLAGEVVGETLAGCSDLLVSREMDTLGVRRQVTSPGGVTSRGLATLERAGLRTALGDALTAVLDRAASR